jgi:alkylated DNA repair protein alkB family protein 4
LHIDKCLQKFEQASINSAKLEMICSDPVVGNLKVTTVEELPGLFLIYNFISEEEEDKIMRVVESTEYMDWKFSSFNGNCYSKYYGVKTQFGLPDELRLVRKNDAAQGEHDIPPGLFPYMERFKHCVALNPHIFTNEFRDFKPNECNMNSYRPAEGHYLRPHFDDRFLSGPILMNLSLCGDAKMTYAKPENANLSTNAIATGAFGHTVTVPLPRRCLQLVSGTARWSYTHEIRPADILDPRRVSITWRQSGGKKGILSKAAREGEDVTSLLRKHASSASEPAMSVAISSSQSLSQQGQQVLVKAKGYEDAEEGEEDS